MGLELTCSENTLSTGNQKHPVNKAIIRHFDFQTLAIHSKGLLMHGAHLK